MAATQQQNSVKVVDICKIKPDLLASTTPPPPTTESPLTVLTLPLTFYDTLWLRFPPVERLYFYQLTESDSSPSRFNSVILPALKHSLSLALHYYFPLSGNLTWPPSAPAPTIFYNPEDDNDSACSVSLTVAVSSADFHHLSGDGVRDSSESFAYVPQLPVSDDVASLFAVQVTLFPYKGFSVGYTNHHCVLDGRGTTSFMKSWAYFCNKLIKDPFLKSETEHDTKHRVSSDWLLPEELRPVFDRSCVKDTKGIGDKFLKMWKEIMEKFYPEILDNNPRNLKILPQVIPTDSVRATFELTRHDLNKIKNMILSGYVNNDDQTQRLVLSTFVLTCAYVFVSMVKARSTVCGGEGNREVCFVFSVDYKTRVDPVVPANYFGNCIMAHDITFEAGECCKENGVSFVAERISGIVKGLEKGDSLFERVDNLISLMKGLIDGVQTVSVAGSNRFGVYETDFGWGKPTKVEIASIGRTGAIALADSRRGDGGVELGVALPRCEMEAFASFFVDGLKN